MDFLALGSLAFLIALAAPRFPLPWRLSTSVFLSVPQLYVVPAGEVVFSLALLSSVSLWPELVREFRNIVRHPGMLALYALVSVQILSWAWSPDVRLAFRTLVYTLPFPLVASAAYALAKRSPTSVARLLALWCLLTVLQGILVVAFRTSPGIEAAYLTTRLAGLFAGPSTVAGLLDGTLPNNILDPHKAGGMLVNGNIAAVYLGTASVVAFLTGRILGASLLKGVALFLWLSVFFTGSKAGMLFALGIPALAALARYVRLPSATSRLVAALAAVAVLPLALLILLQALLSQGNTSGFASDITTTIASRLLIWLYAADEITRHPLLGQGFGGWEAGFATFAWTHAAERMPPHNTLIYLWSQSGLLAPVLAVLFVYHVFRLARFLIRHGGPQAKELGWMLLLVYGWIFLHGMGETGGLLGDVRVQPLFATLLGFGYAIKWRERLAEHMVSARAGPPERFPVPAARLTPACGIPRTQP